MGRNCKLTKELQNKLCGLIEEGHFIEVSVKSCGITPRTYYNWMVEGSKAKSGKKFQFFHAIKKAESTAIIDFTRDILRHGEKTWQAKAWVGQRRWRDLFGDIQTVEHKGKIEIEETEDIFIKTAKEFIIGADKQKEFAEALRKKAQEKKKKEEAK